MLVAELIVIVIAVVLVTSVLRWDHRRRLVTPYITHPPPKPANERDEGRYWSYVELQYQRVAAHESNRLQVSSFVIAASILALGLIANSSDQGVKVVASVGVILTNVIAMVFSANSRRWVKVHQTRASQALEAVSPQLKALQENVDTSFGLDMDSSRRNALIRGNTLTNALHATLALIAAFVPLWS